MPTVIATLSALAIAGVLIATVAWRRPTPRHALDLRSEVRAEQASLQTALDSLRTRMDPSTHSRTASAELDLDLSEAESLRSEVAAADSDFKGLSDMEVEIKLVQILSLSLRAGILTDKYPEPVA